jgi:hypothetical protein
MMRALAALEKLGFETSAVGRATASIRGSRAELRRLKSILRAHERHHDDSNRPADGPHRTVAELIDSVAPQRAARRTKTKFFASNKGKPSALKPSSLKPASLKSEGKFALNGGAPGPSADPPSAAFPHLAPADLVVHLKATQVHQDGNRGDGIRVAILDTGFAPHPFFTTRNLKIERLAAALAGDPEEDSDGHGTGISANAFVLAPDATLIGVKLGPSQPGQAGISILEGLQLVMSQPHRPHIISLSVGVNVPQGPLPEDCVALATEIAAAIESGIIIVAATGDGERLFPAQMPEVIAVGGVHIEAEIQEASNLASAYTSKVYAGRNVPDVCGLMGMAPTGRYIALPVPPGSALDFRARHFDGTAEDDGWAFFSGTSSTAPQVAGVCALMLNAAKPRQLTPAEVKAQLKQTAIDIVTGVSSRQPTPGEPAPEAGQLVDIATGAGLVDAARACTF